MSVIQPSAALEAGSMGQEPHYPCPVAVLP